MESPEPHNQDSPAESPIQGDAIPQDTDREIWVTIEGEGPFTLHGLILANMEPGVTPLSQFAATIIRSLEIGETYEAFGDAPITRVPNP